MQTFKIGEKMVVEKSYEIKTLVTDTILKVKKGDVGFIDSHGVIHYLSGQARGKIHNIADVEVKGYDIENIAELIYGRLNAVYGLELFMHDEEIQLEEFKDSIEDVLSEIL